jgi:hypothetical protein
MLVGMAEAKCPEMSHFFQHRYSVGVFWLWIRASLVKSEQCHPQRSTEQPSLHFKPHHKGGYGNGVKSSHTINLGVRWIWIHYLHIQCRFNPGSKSLVPAALYDERSTELFHGNWIPAIQPPLRFPFELRNKIMVTFKTNREIIFIANVHATRFRSVLWVVRYLVWSKMDRGFM